MFADYYLIRRRRLNVPALFKLDSAYAYGAGINLAAYLAHVAASVLGVIYLRYSWLISVPTAIVLYVALMKLWILRVHPGAGGATDAGGGTEAGEEADAGLGTSAGRTWNLV
jgi:NCS1 family nucleobase:cation symporter-1